MDSSSTDLKSYYLDSANQNTLRNYVMTELSKKYNVQPVVSQINSKFPQIMKYIANSIKPPSSLDFTGSINYLNNITIEKTISGFQAILEPYAYPSYEETPAEPKTEIVKPDNSDVGNLYSKLMTERDYNQSSYSELSSPIRETNNDQPPLFEMSNQLPVIPEEPVLPNYPNNSPFQERLMMLNQNRASQLQMERNQVDFETRDRNYQENVMGEKQPEMEQANYNNDLQNSNPLYRDNQSVNNIGKDLVSQETIEEHRFNEYKDEKHMDYRKIDRQVTLNAKDRVWWGEVINNTIQGSLEPYRYRFQLNNNKESGIYLQNRHRNITYIRISSIFLGGSKADIKLPPYVYIYIPELENRIETSIPSRKYVFAMLKRDDGILQHQRYTNYMSANEYFPSPLAELPTMTFEILNPMGDLISNNKDNLKIISIGVDDLVTPKNIVLGLDMVYNTKEYLTDETIIIKNFAFTDGSNVSLSNYLMKNTGHLITTPAADLSSNKYLKYVWISIPSTIDSNGNLVLDQIATDFVSYLTVSGNPVTNIYGQLIDINIQPTLVLEFSKIEPNSNEINQSRVTII